MSAYVQKVHFYLNNYSHPVRDPFNMILNKLQKGVDVPNLVQTGPTCGLFALSMVLHYYNIKNSVIGPSQDSLLSIAQNLGYTTKGEMFSAENLGKLASLFGLQYQVIDHWTNNDVIQALDDKKVLLVPFDVDDDGGIGFFNGNHAHWSVVEALVNPKEVIAVHGWSTKELLYDLDSLRESNSQLYGSDVDGVHYDCKDLRNKIVLLWK